MFKPVEFYFKEKIAEARQKADTPVNLNKNELKVEYLKLKNDEILKYVKEAEAAYDTFMAHSSENGAKKTKTQPFSFYLSKNELETLMESYGLPEKIPSFESKLRTSHNYFVHMQKMKAMEGVEDKEEQAKVGEKARQEAAKTWLGLNANEKNKHLAEYYEEINELKVALTSIDYLNDNGLNLLLKKAFNLYNEKFFKFARNLPENRIFDYQVNLNQGMKNFKRIPSENEVIANPEKQTEAFKAVKHLSPFQVFYDKHKEEFAELSTFMAKNKARAQFSSLPDKKKLKYIKKAEEKFDAFIETELKNEESKPFFYNLLNRTELKLLLESYNLPEPVPSNLGNYYLKLHINEYTEDRMKNVYAKFGALSDIERAHLIIEHHQELDKHAKEKEKFLSSLPARRLPDYEEYQKKFEKKSKKLSGEEATKIDLSKMEVESELEVNNTEIHDETGSVILDETQIDESLLNSSTQNETIDSFVSKHPKLSENAMSLFFNEELKKDVKEKMSEEESVGFFRKTMLKWDKLSDEEKEKFEEKVKKEKKTAKRSLKKFFKANSSVDSAEVKAKIKERNASVIRKLCVKVNGEERDELFLIDEANLVESELKNVDIKTKKPNEDSKNTTNSAAQKRKSNNEENSNKKQKKLNS